MKHSTILHAASILALSLAVAPLTHGEEPAASKSAQPASAATPQKQQFDKRTADWKKTLEEVAAAQANMHAARDAESHRAAAKRFNEVAAKANAEALEVRQAAETAYQADAENLEAANLLFYAAIDELRRDNYAEALRLSEMLIENKYPNTAIYRIAASAAFPLMRLEDAKKYIEAAKADEEDDPSLGQFMAQLAQYESLWEQEKKIREKEKEADDLPRVKIETNKGDIVVELFENEAPNTVANFISLVEKGFYDGIQFHRVLPGFMAQVGDPRLRKGGAGAKSAADDGPGYAIACECVRPDHRKHFLGSLSMAHAGRDTGGSQFFLTFLPTPHLDGGHTVFGRIIEGMDVLPKLERIDPQHDEPVDTIIKAEVLRKRDHPYVPKKVGQQ